MPINLEIEIENTKFSAILLEEKAPKTCKALLKVLPLESRARHAAWSGDGICAHFPPDIISQKIEPENTTIYGGPGDVMWMVDPRFQEISVVYGWEQFRSRSGPLLKTNFAKINDNLVELSSLGRRVLLEGEKKILIREKKY